MRFEHPLHATPGRAATAYSSPVSGRPPKLTRPTTLCFALGAILALPLLVDETASHGDRAALRQVRVSGELADERDGVDIRGTTAVRSLPRFPVG
jgi:hypothetical protein